MAEMPVSNSENQKSFWEKPFGRVTFWVLGFIVVPRFGMGGW